MEGAKIERMLSRIQNVALLKRTFKANLLLCHLPVFKGAAAAAAGVFWQCALLVFLAVDNGVLHVYCARAARKRMAAGKPASGAYHVVCAWSLWHRNSALASST